MAEKEYIEREALINVCKEIIQDKWNEKACPVSWSHAYADFIDDIENQPAADVAPVKRGKWKKIKGSYYTSTKDGGGNVKQCSVCGEPSPCGFGTPYCAICGAKMDGGNENG